MFQMARGNPLMGKTNRIIKSMLCMTLILFPQMFNPQVVKLYCILDSGLRMDGLLALDLRA